MWNPFRFRCEFIVWKIQIFRVFSRCACMYVRGASWTHKHTWTIASRNLIAIKYAFVQNLWIRNSNAWCRRKENAISARIYVHIYLPPDSVWETKCTHFACVLWQIVDAHDSEFTESRARVKSVQPKMEGFRRHHRLTCIQLHEFKYFSSVGECSGVSVVLHILPPVHVMPRIRLQKLQENVENSVESLFSNVEVLVHAKCAYD